MQLWTTPGDLMPMEHQTRLSSVRLVKMSLGEHRQAAGHPGTRGRRPVLEARSGHKEGRSGHKEGRSGHEKGPAPEGRPFDLADR